MENYTSNFINSTTQWKKIYKNEVKLTRRYVAMATSSKTNFSGSVTSGQTYNTAVLTVHTSILLQL